MIVAIPTFLYIKRDLYYDFGVKDNYSWKYFFQQLGDISTKKLLVSTIDYNGFIFGSSRSTSVYACYLQKKIPDTRFFHYANWNETIGGIERKLLLIDSLGYTIDHVVIYIDTDYSFADNGLVHANDHYLLTSQKRNKYLFSHYKSFFTNMSMDKLKLLLGLKIEGDGFPDWESDLYTNDPNQLCKDSIIARYGDIEDSPAHRNTIDFLKDIGFLYERPGHQLYLPSQISDLEKSVLYNIKSLFEKHNTNFYVILTPLYDQLKFSMADQKILEDCFGDNLYDFSGINDITNNIYNYPDRKHFQRYISKFILDSVVKRSRPFIQ
ncbi:MAG: hypothetical protein ACNA7V_12375 [Bacteroidales bacterium]